MENPLNGLEKKTFQKNKSNNNNKEFPSTFAAQLKGTWRQALTVSDGVEGPLVVLEERVTLDFLHAVSTQPHLPPNKKKE